MAKENILIKVVSPEGTGVATFHALGEITDWNVVPVPEHEIEAEGITEQEFMDALSAVSHKVKPSSPDEALSGT